MASSHPKSTTSTIEWPRQLATPSELMQSLQKKSSLKLIKSPLVSKLVLQTVGTWAYLLANVFNTSRIFNLDIFQQELKRVEEEEKGEAKKAPLLTYSNHISCIDDPILWGSLLPLSYYTKKTESVRWSPAATEICFSRPWHSTFFALGKTFPISRGSGINQPAMDFAATLLRYNQWLHLFPEGKVMRDNKQQPISNKDRGYLFKWGIAELILNYFRFAQQRNHPKEKSSIRILPFYHLGLDEILPIGWPYLPRAGKRITIYIRPKVIDMDRELLSEILAKRTLLKGDHDKRRNELERIKLTNYLEEETEKLIKPTEELHMSD